MNGWQAYSHLQFNTTFTALVCHTLYNRFLPRLVPDSPSSVPVYYYVYQYHYHGNSLTIYTITSFTIIIIILLLNLSEYKTWVFSYFNIIKMMSILTVANEAHYYDEC
jgi:hypothetical protein